MKILAHVHGYPNTHNAGAEWTLHAILKWLVARGHECEVIYQTRRGEYELDGVRVTGPPHDVPGVYRKADAVITHLDLTRGVVRYARATRRPLVHLVHNDKQLAFHRVTEESAQLVVFNSRWIAREVHWAGPSVVLHPPVFARDYATTPGRMVTLMNMIYSKGVEVFAALAGRMPETGFLGVLGSYGQQVPVRVPNVTTIPNGPNARENVYARTRVLLMPSDYESWGRTAVEAAASGIPTVAHPTPGLLECLGPAGTFVDRDDIAQWHKMVARLVTCPEAWQDASLRARARSAELDPESELLEFEAALLKL